MNTDFEKQPGQRRPVLLVSGAVAVCLFVLALLERRRTAATPARATRSYSASDTTAPVGSRADGASGFTSEPWAPANDVDTPVWEGVGLNAPGQWPAAYAEPAPVAEPVLYDVEGEAEVEVEPSPTVFENPRLEVEPWHNEVEVPLPEVEAWQPEPVLEDETYPTAGEPELELAPSELAPSGHEPSEHDAPAPAPDQWFGSFAPSDAWQPQVETPYGPQPVDETPVAEEAPADADIAASSADESVIELPALPPPPVESDPKRLPPPRLRRFMGTGATVLVLGLVLCAGVLASGATADSTSDPATVPDAVGTTAPLPGVLPDTTTDTTVTDTTATDTTATGTTTTDTTTTDTTTTDTTTTDTTTTDTTSTATTPTDTTTTDTTPTTPPDPTTTTPPPADPAPADPPASDPVAVPAVPEPTAPAVVPTTPVSDPVPLSTPVTPKAKAPEKKTVAPTHTTAPPAKAKQVASPTTGTPSASGPPVVTLASGADAIGSILSRSVIPAVDASLLPTPAQVSFYVKAAKPLSPLPTLGRVEHPVAQRLVAAGRNGKVAWTVLAAVSRLESNLGKRSGPLAGRHLPTAPTGDGLAALATFLRANGATRNPLTPTKARKALTLYFDGSTRKADRAIALAALYGALGPAGMQKGVRAVTARLQRRVLRDKRVHLTVAGRSDIRHGRVDPRVLVTLEYLANSFHKVGVSDLVSGGALFSRSGSVSAHLYGRAADVSSLHGKVVRGHQGPGTMTELAIKKLLLLPKSLRPRQVISLMDVDGPTGNHGSFALPDHYDRIQIDY
jgi:hypothetical protein